ncbi:hypothetical protein A6R68_08968, partial [Neotoma lepida]
RAGSTTLPIPGQRHLDPPAAGVEAGQTRRARNCVVRGRARDSEPRTQAGARTQRTWTARAAGGSSARRCETWRGHHSFLAASEVLKKLRIKEDQTAVTVS